MPAPLRTSRPLTKARNSRYLSALRQVRSSPRVPNAVLLEGHGALMPDFISWLTLALGPVEARELHGNADDLSPLEPTTAEGGPRPTLVLWHDFQDVTPSPAVTSALLALRPVRNVYVIAEHHGAPSAEPWHYCFDWRVTADLSAKEARSWVQALTGGLTADGADAVLERTAGDFYEARSAIAALTALTERATVADVDAVVLPLPELRLADALRRCDKRTALAWCPEVTDPARVLGLIEADAYGFWVLAENARWALRGRPGETDAALSLAKGTTEALGPYVRLWSRQKVGERLGLVADAAEHLAAGARRGVLDRLTVLW